jgi:carbonic anhydrase/acetyltransferase-like protein (isoleucine patch superfamily)
MEHIHETAWIAPGAVVKGNVTFGEQVNVWFNAAVRGIGMGITVGNCSNIQDCVVIHGDIGNDVVIGDYVSLGHGCVIHGCTIEDHCVIGMNAVVLDRAHIGTGSIVGAGAVVPAGAQIPPNSLVLGMPAKVKRTLSPEEVAGNIQNAKEYLDFAAAEKAVIKD